MCIALEFNTTTAHQESAGDQQVSVSRIEELRRAVELYYNRRDPFREPDGSLTLLDEHGLIDMVSYVGVDEEFWPFYTAAFFSLRVDEALAPIVNKFGRFPWRNAVEGRESTAGEVEWIGESGHFGEAGPGVARRVRRDVEAGTWTPLGEGEGEKGSDPAPVGDVSSGVSLGIAVRRGDDRGPVEQDESSGPDDCQKSHFHRRLL